MSGEFFGSSLFPVEPWNGRRDSAGLPTHEPERWRPAQESARLPVLYLLHGYSDNHKTWSSATSIKDMADQYSIIVICPDAGYSSWYFDSPEDPAWRYETFVAKELVTYADANFKTLAKRESRAIAGQSMGGHGAMFLSIGIRASSVWLYV